MWVCVVWEEKADDGMAERDVGSGVWIRERMKMRVGDGDEVEVVYRRRRDKGWGGVAWGWR